MASKTAGLERAIAEGATFDQASVDKVKRFASFCQLLDGPHIGQPVQFLPWILEDVIAPLYGWKRADGTRLYRRGSIWTPRKQV